MVSVVVGNGVSKKVFAPVYWADTTFVRRKYWMSFYETKSEGKTNIQYYSISK